MEERPPVWRIAVNILNKQTGAADKGWSSSRGGGLSEVLRTDRRTTWHSYETQTCASDLK